HVNGEDPEACVYVAELAAEFRQTFHCDVVLDMFCYRRHGHNEGDEPSFTQPLMYRKIAERPTISEVYTEQLVMSGDLTTEEAEAITARFQEKLQVALEDVKAGHGGGGMHGFEGDWESLSPHYSHEPAQTAIPYERIVTITEAISLV